jgi:hypothetical protein
MRMIQLPNQFPTRLVSDLERIYREGLPKDIPADYVPTMTTLAEAISGERHAGSEDYYSLQLENLIRKAIGRVPMTGERRNGVEKLFGITGGRILGLEARRESAAPSLGYKDADTLRRGEVNKRPFHDVLLEELLTQMVALGTEHDFAFKSDPEPTDEDETSQASAPLAPGDRAAPETPVPGTSASSSRTALRRRLGWRWKLVAPIGAALALGAVTLTAMGAWASHQGYHDTWGPNRLVYDYARYNGNNDCNDPTNPATYYGRCGAITTYPVFNSFINTPFYGDEAKFFDGFRAERSSRNAEDPIANVTSGDKIVVLRIYVDNMAKVYEKEPALTTAYNTRVRVSLPTNISNSLVAYAYISADRAVTVNDSVDLTSHQSFSLEYIPGSAVLYDRVDGHKRSYRLSDEIIGSEGALIGTKTTNGVLAPTNVFSGSIVNLEIRAVPQAG